MAERKVTERTNLKKAIEYWVNIYTSEMKKGEQSNQEVMSDAMKNVIDYQNELDKVLGWVI